MERISTIHLLVGTISRFYQITEVRKDDCHTMHQLSFLNELGWRTVIVVVPDCSRLQHVSGKAEIQKATPTYVVSDVAETGQPQS